MAKTICICTHPGCGEQYGAKLQEKCELYCKNCRTPEGRAEVTKCREELQKNNEIKKTEKGKDN